MAGWTVTMSSSSISADGAGGTTKTTIAPVTDWIVHDGESFLVAEKLYGTALPGTEGTFLLDWTAYQVGGSVSLNALAIQASVADASIVSGLSNPGIATLNGLLGSLHR